MIKQEKNFSIQVPRCLICYKFDIALKSACPCIMQYIHLVQNYILVNDLDNNCENLVDYFSVRQCVIEIFLTQSLTNFHQYFTDKHLSCISNQVLGQYSFIKVGKYPQSSKTDGLLMKVMILGSGKQGFLCDDVSQNKV